MCKKNPTINVVFSLWTLDEPLRTNSFSLTSDSDKRMYRAFDSTVLYFHLIYSNIFVRIGFRWEKIVFKKPHRTAVRPNM